MSSYNEPNIKTYLAGADYSTTGQYKFVKLSPDNTVTVCSTKGEKGIGILQNKPDSGEAAEVAIHGGGALVLLGATVARNQQITTNGDGEGIIPDAAGQSISAQCMKSGVVDDIVACMVTFGETYNAEA